METENFDRVTIRGENTNRHLCMNKKGKLVTRVCIVFLMFLLGFKTEGKATNENMHYLKSFVKKSFIYASHNSRKGP